MEEDKKEEIQVKIIPSWVLQSFDRLMAQALHRSECFDYYFFEAFKLVRPYIGDQVLKDHFGDRWQKVNIEFIKLGAIASSVKTHFDRLKKDNKSLSDKEFRDYLYAMSEMLFSDVVCEAFVVLCKKSNLGRHSINHQAFKEQMLKPYTFNIDQRRDSYGEDNK